MALNASQPGGKAAPNVNKNVVPKTCAKETAMSPTAPSVDAERTELLGSLTTEQQQRTSARVIKKLKLEPPSEKRKRADGSEDVPDCDTPNKPEDKEPKFPTVKQRMPKALWSADEKRLFFEALNEFGKDFDAITTFICAKLKKKGVLDANLKNKTQVSHFYYRTWHKLSKHVQFDENVKKVVQELYALINYGELRRKLVSVNEKTCARLGEMVNNGSIVVRARGRNLRVRTPMCRALRRLNQITERVLVRGVCGRAWVTLSSRDAASWARVQAAAHNPRTVIALPLAVTLHDMLKALSRRWKADYNVKLESTSNDADIKVEDYPLKEEDCKNVLEEAEIKKNVVDDADKGEEDHLNLETDRLILEEFKLPQRPVLHVGPRPAAQIHLPVVSPSEQLSSQKICFSSYLERMREKSGGGAKARTTKRQRKDSTIDKEIESKKFKLDEGVPTKLMHIEETAIDGIELMASYKINQDDDDKQTAAYTTEEEKEMRSEETAEEEADKEIDGDNIIEKDRDATIYKDLKDRDGIIDKDLIDKDRDIAEKEKCLLEKDKDMSEKEKDSFSEMEDDEKYNKSDSDNESDHAKSDKTEQDRKFNNLKVKFRIRPKKRGGSEYTLVLDKDPEECKEEQHQDLEPQEDRQVDLEHNEEKQVDLETAVRQVKKGWSIYDCGTLTIGDLYLMFGSRSKIELDYWWAPPTAPLPQKPNKSVDKSTDADKSSPTYNEKLNKSDKTPDKVDSSVEDDKNDHDLMSPKNHYSQDSNDGMSGDERKNENTASPDHKSSSINCNATMKLVSKLVNRPTEQRKDGAGLSQLSDRLKRLLALVGNPHVTSAGVAGAKCECGHVCNQKKHAQMKPSESQPRSDATVFRHPTPLQQPTTVDNDKFSLEDLPARRKRGRPRITDRRVVVQRLLPLLPKLPPPNNLLPVRLLRPGAPRYSRILPRPPAPRPPPAPNDLSFFYVLSESNGQFYFHDGERRIPISAAADQEAHDEDGNNEEEEERETKMETAASAAREPDASQHGDGTGAHATNFLLAESPSLSPSRLLRADGWLDAAADFSLSSFLHHLDDHHQQAAVDSQLRSLLGESSVDYVAKFADLAAEVTDDSQHNNKDST